MSNVSGNCERCRKLGLTGWCSGNRSDCQNKLLGTIEALQQSKYNSRKVELDGITFDSQKEADKYAELKLLLRDRCQQTPNFCPMCGRKIEDELAEFRRVLQRGK